MWDLRGPGIEPMSFALAGGFLTTGPPETCPCQVFSRVQQVNPFGLFWEPVNRRSLSSFTFMKKLFRDSLVTHWRRIPLPMQETQVRSLIWEDPTRLGAVEPAHHNYWACAPDPGSPQATTTEARAWSPCFATSEATAMRSSCTTTRERTQTQQQRSSTAINK